MVRREVYGLCTSLPDRTKSTCYICRAKRPRDASHLNLRSSGPAQTVSGMGLGAVRVLGLGVLTSQQQLYESELQNSALHHPQDLSKTPKC